jgi:hypothetical protein
MDKLSAEQRHKNKPVGTGEIAFAVWDFIAIL